MISIWKRAVWALASSRKALSFPSRAVISRAHGPTPAPAPAPSPPAPKCPRSENPVRGLDCMRRADGSCMVASPNPVFLRSWLGLWRECYFSDSWGVGLASRVSARCVWDLGLWQGCLEAQAVLWGWISTLISTRITESWVWQRAPTRLAFNPLPPPAAPST